MLDLTLRQIRFVQWASAISHNVGNDEELIDCLIIGV